MKYLGVDYYPEQWGMEHVDADLDDIVALGANLIRIGDFAWDVFEPEEGHYDFAFFAVWKFVDGFRFYNFIICIRIWNAYATLSVIFLRCKTASRYALCKTITLPDLNVGAVLF